MHAVGAGYGLHAAAIARSCSFDLEIRSRYLAMDAIECKARLENGAESLGKTLV